MLVIPSHINKKPGPKEGSPRDVAPAIIDELKTKLGAGEFVTGVQAQRWLEERHGITRPYKTVWRWLKKAGGVLLVPRPSHSKKDPAAAGEFRQTLLATDLMGLCWGQWRQTAFPLLKVGHALA